MNTSAVFESAGLSLRKVQQDYIEAAAGALTQDHKVCVEQDDKGWDARKRAYCLKIQPATGSFARNLIYSTKPRLIPINA
ncbi:hypothetical protein AAIZ36_01165 (plasmid) [Klebsiella pneumoniae]